MLSMYDSDNSKRKQNAERGRTIFRIVFIISFLIGSISEVNLMWDIADAILAFEVALNMLCLLITGNIFINVTKDYIQTIP